MRAPAESMWTAPPCGARLSVKEFLLSSAREPEEMWMAPPARARLEVNRLPMNFASESWRQAAPPVSASLPVKMLPSMVGELLMQMRAPPARLPSSNVPRPFLIVKPRTTAAAVSPAVNTSREASLAAGLVPGPERIVFSGPSRDSRTKSLPGNLSGSARS